MKTKKNTRVARWLALAMGFAAAGGTAHAAVIYNSAPGFTVTSGQGVEIPPFTGYSGPAAFYFDVYPGVEWEMYWELSKAWFDGYTGNDIADVNLGDDVGPETPYWGIRHYGLIHGSTMLNNGTSFFGISFNNGGTINYGWMSINAAGLWEPHAHQSITLNAYAYDNTGASIKVGATSAATSVTSAVPEASTSLGLLALGAGGVLTRRRLKPAA